MKKLLFITLATILFTFLFGCEWYSSRPNHAFYYVAHPSAVRKVKETILVTAGGVTIEETVNTLIGMKGTVNWDAFKPLGYENYPNVILVEANLKKYDKEEELHCLKLQYLFNTKTKIVEQGYIGLDDESNVMGMLEFMLY